MVEEKILEALNDVDEQYIDEAMPLQMQEDILSKTADTHKIRSFPRKTKSSRNFLRHWWIPAACICMVLLSVFALLPSSANSFTVKACALELNPDGTLHIQETEFFDQPDVWGGCYAGENFFVNVGLRYGGENLKQVKFSTKDGFLAKQYVNQLDPEKNVSRLYVGADQRLVMVGDQFEILGSSVVFTEESYTDDLLLFWGTKADVGQRPESCMILAEATFLDGSTQTETLQMDLSGTGAASFQADEEELHSAQLQSDYYQQIPLADCQPLPSYTKAVTDVYVVESSFGENRYEIHEDMEFDLDGMYRCGYFTDWIPDVNQGEKRFLIPVIHRKDDGSLEGLLYAVPDELRYPEDPNAEQD